MRYCKQLRGLVASNCWDSSFILRFVLIDINLSLERPPFIKQTIVLFYLSKTKNKKQKINYKYRPPGDLQLLELHSFWDGRMDAVVGLAISWPFLEMWINLDLDLDLIDLPLTKSTRVSHRDEFEPLDTWTIGHLDTWTLEHLNTWTLEHLNTWTLERLNAWTLELLNTCGELEEHLLEDTWIEWFVLIYTCLY